MSRHGLDPEFAWKKGVNKRVLYCALPAVFLAYASASAADVERGKTLYDTRCVSCHDRSVHNRAARKALTVADIRTQVRRWDAYLGGAWREAEVNDVTAYLNQLYYKYPCSPDVCPEPKAGLELGASRGSAPPDQRP